VSRDGAQTLVVGTSAADGAFDVGAFGGCACDLVAGLWRCGFDERRASAKPDEGGGLREKSLRRAAAASICRQRSEGAGGKEPQRVGTERPRL
jgi:hypothetical protein